MGLYMFISTGIPIEIHYCMGHKAGVDFYFTTDEFCQKCGMKESDNACCGNQYQFFKLIDSHQLTEYSHLTQPFFGIIIHPKKHVAPSFNIFPNDISVANYTPPNRSGPPLFIKNCVFRI